MTEFSFEVIESESLGTVFVGYIRRDISADDEHTYTWVSLWVVPGTI